MQIARLQAAIISTNPKAIRRLSDIRGRTRELQEKCIKTILPE